MNAKIAHCADCLDDIDFNFTKNGFNKSLLLNKLATSF